MMTFNETDLKIGNIGAANAEAAGECRRYVDSLIKPPGSMGKLEDIAVKLSGISGQLKNRVDKKRIIVLCADNGVVEEGVSSAPVSVTMSQAVNMTRGITGMSSMARHFGIDVQVVDVGIATDYDCDAIIDRKIRKGTGNIAAESALTTAEVIRAVNVGIELSGNALEDGIQVIGVGEMGIGNTTSSSAVLAAITHMDPAGLVGRGGGLTDRVYEHKKGVVRKSVNRFYSSVNENDRSVTRIMAELGGLDIAAMCGVFIGAAMNRIPVVIDGFISVVAALCAYRMAPGVVDYMFPSHASVEPGYSAAIAQLGLTPWLGLDMRLGEGSGCVLAFQVMEAACAMMNGMATFSSGGIDDAYLDEIRAMDKR